MKINRLVLSALLASLSAGVSTIAAADDGLTNWVGVSVGNTDFNSKNLSGITPGTLDDTGSAWKMYLGFPITKTLGLEVGYMNLGKGSISNAAGTSTSHTRTKVYNADLVGSYDINESFSLFGKAGIYFWQMHSDTTGPASTSDDDGTKLTYGLGFQYNPNKELGFRLEWERFDKLGFKNTTGEMNADLYSIGAIYKFKFF
jgi:OOP family OmpA-OmpF porin